MSSEVLVGLLALCGTLAGSLVSNRLVTYRLEQLEKKVDKHNSVVERMALAEEKLKVVNHRLDDLEEEQL
ncbi:MAG: hypothetical protein RR209_04280 [Angelakisella sp.]